MSDYVSLGLFFTRGMSLAGWERAGLLEREVAIYRRLVAAGVSVFFISYGGPEELEYSSQIPGVTILCNQWRLPGFIYEQFLSWLHRHKLWRVRVFKTNQANGGQFALRAAQTFGSALIARCGYHWSSFVKKQGSLHAYWRAAWIERRLFSGADRVVVTTPEIAQLIREQLPQGRHIDIIPNYVDTDCFRPKSELPKRFDLAFVGRISDQKNVDILLEAIRPLQVSLLVIGDGPLRPRLQERFSMLGDRVRWAGMVSNAELPRQLNQARAFILPSRFEGQPKALMEAMACALPVIGTNVAGIRDLIRHEDTGWLCEPTPADIRRSIVALRQNGEHATRLGANARRHIEEHFSLDRIVALELELIRELSERPRGRLADSTAA